MDIIQEAKAISNQFKEIEAEYNSPDSLIDMGNWYYISKKQDEAISRLVDRLEELEEDNQVLRSCMRNAREVYIGMDGFKPETAPEGYCLWLLEQMYNELCDKPLPPVDKITEEGK